MSQENVKSFKRALEGYNRRDIAPLLDAFHSEADWYPFTAQVEGDEAYHGHEGLRQWWANLDAAFEEFGASTYEFRDEGDVLVVLGHFYARFRSGVTLDTDVGWFLRYRDGLVVWGRVYESHAETLEAAGLRE